MKFLVFSKPLVKSELPKLAPEEALKAHAKLLEFIQEGIIERAFVLEGGGSAYIVNAPNRADITKAVREHGLSLQSRIEILQITDFTFTEAGEIATER